MQLEELLQIIRKWYWLVILGTVVAVISGYLVLRAFTPWPRYEATTTIMIDDDSLNNDAAQALRETYAELAVRKPVTQAVVEALHLPQPAQELGDLIKAEVIGRTQLLEISVTYSNRQQAAAIANEVAHQLSLVSVNSDESSPVQVIAEAEAPSRPQWGAYVGLVVAGVTGFTVAGGLVILIEYLNDRIRTAQDVKEHLGLPVLATVNFAGRTTHGVLERLRRWYREKRPGEVVAEQTSLSEKYQWLCFGIDHADGNQLQKLLVTGPDALEEQLSLVVGLASTWAENERKVVLVNAGSSPPVVSEWFGFADNGRAHTPPEAQPDGQPSGKGEIITAGAETDEAIALAATTEETATISTTPQNDVLDKLAQEADMVIVNGPSILATPQTAVLSSHVDAILLVLAAGQTRTKRAQEALKVLEMAGGNILGVTLLSF